MSPFSLVVSQDLDMATAGLISCLGPDHPELSCYSTRSQPEDRFWHRPQPGLGSPRREGYIRIRRAWIVLNRSSNVV